MAKRRYDISNKIVLEALKDKNRFPTIKSIARHFDFSESIIWKVRDGKRPDMSQKVEELDEVEELCTCCGIRPKSWGNRYLCEVCFKGHPDEPVDEHDIDHKLKRR